MKDVLMITHFTQTPGEAGNGRFDYLANMLCVSNSVEVVTTSFSHRTKKQREISDEYDKLNYKLTLLHESGYKKNVSLKRFYSHWVFGRSLKKYLKTRKKPDVIYSSAPSLDVAYVAAKYAKENNIPFVLDVQDLWPEAFKMVFNIPVVSDIIFAPMEKKANCIYRSADVVLAVSQTYVDRVLSVNKTAKNAFPVFLGTELEYFDKLNEENKFERKDSDILLGYAGTLGHSYDIERVIDALDILRSQGYSNIKFLVMGDGPLKERFEQYAQDKNISAEFTGRLQYGEMVGRLCACDIVINPIARGSAGSIINKHGDYAASGIAVINSQESPEYRKLVEDYNMGLNCGCGNSADMAEKIKKLADDPELRRLMGENARRCAEEKFDRKKTYGKIIEIINNL